jgi:hypothetical protein
MKPKITKLENGQYLLENVQVVWPELYTAKHFKNNPANAARYQATALVDEVEGKDVVAFLDKEIAALALSKHKIKKLPDADSCFTSGDSSANEALHGKRKLALYSYPNDNSAGKGKPSVIARDGKTKIREGDDNEIVSGTICNVIFDLYTPNGWKKVSGGLKVVQRVAKGAFIGAEQSLDALPSLPDIDEDGEDLAEEVEEEDEEAGV